MEVATLLSPIICTHYRRIIFSTLQFDFLMPCLWKGIYCWWTSTIKSTLKAIKLHDAFSYNKLYSFIVCTLATKNQSTSKNSLFSRENFYSKRKQNAEHIFHISIFLGLFLWPSLLIPAQSNQVMSPTPHKILSKISREWESKWNQILPQKPYK